MNQVRKGCWAPSSNEETKGHPPQLILFQMYKALVESHHRYADVAWGSLSNTKISALQRLPNRALDIIQAPKIKDSLIRPTFAIDQMCQFYGSVLMFKIISKICSESLHVNLLKDPR